MEMKPVWREGITLHFLTGSRLFFSFFWGGGCVSMNIIVRSANVKPFAFFEPQSKVPA